MEVLQAGIGRSCFLGSRRFQAQEERGSLWAMEKTWLRVSMTALWGVTALARLEGGRDGGGGKQMGRFWE